MSGWLDHNTWSRVQRLVPIPCADLLAVETAEADPFSLRRIGLIYRGTPHQGSRWCLIGGRILRNESALEAVNRHVRETLGPHIACVPIQDQPLYVAEYFTESKPARLHDPRQHAIALTYAGLLTGEPLVRGEAMRFEWFSPTELPPREAFGFGRDSVIEVVATCLGVSLLFAQRAFRGG